MDQWPTQPMDVMPMANATASVELAGKNVMNAWIFTLDFPTVKITVRTFSGQESQNFYIYAFSSL